MKQAEVFGVAVGGGQQPEHYLGLEELLAVSFAVFGAGQNVEDARHARAAIALVLEVAGRAGNSVVAMQQASA